MATGGEKPTSPLKFNHTWLKEEYYRNLVEDKWVHLSTSSPHLLLYVSNGKEYFMN
jgi:hypothetical protein